MSRRERKCGRNSGQRGIEVTSGDDARPQTHTNINFSAASAPAPGGQPARPIMEEEKEQHFIIPVHGRRQIAEDTSTIPPPDAPGLRDSYPQAAHLREVPDASPSCTEPAQMSAERPSGLAPGHHILPNAAGTPDIERRGRFAGWLWRLEGGNEDVSGRPRKTMLGLTVLRFWAAIVLGIAIVGVAIAVGLALGLANRYV